MHGTSGAHRDLARFARRGLVAGIVVAALATRAGDGGIQIVSASSGAVVRVTDRAADGDAAGRPAVVAVVMPVVASSGPARSDPRRPHPRPLAVVKVPFVCAVHVAEGDPASDD
jgi:hypothetical protein